MADPLLRLAGLKVQMGQTRILHGVDLDVAGGCLALVGRNGVGKSTLCHAVMGMARACEGSMFLRGEEVSACAPHEMERRGVAIVPQGRRLWPSLTVEQHLFLAEKSRTGRWTVPRVYEVFPRLAERRRSGASKLSGGEQQMLAFARALLRLPTLLILDEPSEGLSPLVVEQWVTLMQQLMAEDGMTLLLVEQNLGMALRVADRVAVMVSGRIEHEARVEVFAQDMAAQERYLGLAENQ